MNWYFFYGFVFIQTFLTCYLLIYPITRLAKKLGVVDKPGYRKIHSDLKPLMGGVGICASFFAVVLIDLATAFILSGDPWIRQHFPNILRVLPLVTHVLNKLGIILAGGLSIHLLGLVDDIFKEKIPYQVKFLFQTVIAFAVAIAGVRTNFMPTATLNILITALWIIGITNGFNLLDNLDGLTAGTAVISGLALFSIAALQGQVFFAFVMVALVGASLGFLWHNFHPSRLFMGDSGSLFLGFMFGTLTVMGSYVVKSSTSLMPVVLPLLVLSIPLYDTFSVMFIRWREGRPLFVGDKSHFSHRLLDLGMTHRSTVIFIYLVNVCIGLTAILLPYVSEVGTFLIVLQAVLIYVLITILIIIGRRNRREQKKSE
jgi:UDP-GlcNAc:undecaprenyl-phosphate/decaprenyl-phosphate GlcNAc-1-phosphate transferase